MNILIINSRFYEDIADELLRGARVELDKNKVKYEIINVPGAFEIPAAIGFALKSGKYDGYIALGCVIRGETTHYDYVCSENASGLNKLAIDYNAAIGYGVLTVENEYQAWERAAVDKGNKGAAAAYACIEMIKLKQKFGLS